ncbi:mitochondrial ribosome-associated GTPase 2, partial [Ctenocephalides felis]|uniref:mitochondrial ribosome-associated GTPase 2 n=1 Tax=Ctenocephalides felis TaxID=7515 RepID=UPI000E6E10A0
MFKIFKASFNVPKLNGAISLCQCYSKTVAVALKPKKQKSTRTKTQKFIDTKPVRTIAGDGGDGCISFLQLWANENAGPDGGDGGNGGHVVFEACTNVSNLSHLETILKADSGEKGRGKDCHGRNAPHTVAKVPVGTIIKNSNGDVIGDLSKEGTMFVAARGGAGGKGNHFFTTDIEQAPQISEFGAKGEDLRYVLEIKSMAHMGLIGFPNAGKSTLLQAISRARPKIAPYPFTTLRPHLGMIQYDDFEQIAVADLPGLIEGSSKNRGLGIQFLKHAERCSALLFVLDVSLKDPWVHLDILKNELRQFSPELLGRPHLVIANKIDIEDSKNNLELLESKTDLPVIPISAKVGTNIEKLLMQLRILYDDIFE